MRLPVYVPFLSLIVLSVLAGHTAFAQNGPEKLKLSRLTLPLSTTAGIRIMSPDRMSCVLPDMARVERMPVKKPNFRAPIDRMPIASGNMPLPSDPQFIDPSIKR